MIEWFAPADVATNFFRFVFFAPAIARLNEFMNDSQP